jgi:hypothetical protein
VRTKKYTENTPVNQKNKNKHLAGFKAALRAGTGRESRPEAAGTAEKMGAPALRDRKKY